MGFVVAAGVIWSVLALLSDTKEVVTSVKSISSKRMLVVLLLSAANYWLRVIRFNWYTRKVAVRKIRNDINSIIYFSGLSMNLTPARIGEMVKAYFQHYFFGESFARMAPVVFFERLTDGLAMLVLMSIGVLAFKMGVEIFAFLTIFILFIIWILHQRQAGEFIIQFLRKFPLGDRLTSPLQKALSASFELTKIIPITGGTVLGVIAWALEATGLWVLAGAVGMSMTISNLYIIWFIFSVSAAVGFLSILPGGGGINELSTIGLLERLLGIGYAGALVVTFAFRLVTLWFGVVLGIVAMIYLEKRKTSQ